MAKISTYGVIPSPATLTDLVIGTDTSANNETKNFELSQILSLAPLVTQKASLYTYTTLFPAIGGETDITFDVSEFCTSAFTKLPSTEPWNKIQINTAGYYRIQFMANVYCTSETQFFVWLKVNDSAIGPLKTFAVPIGKYTTVDATWMQEFAAGDDISIGSQSSVAQVTLSFVGDDAPLPSIKSAQIYITQV